MCCPLRRLSSSQKRLAEDREQLPAFTAPVVSPAHSQPRSPPKVKSFEAPLLGSPSHASDETSQEREPPGFISAVPGDRELPTFITTAPAVYTVNASQDQLPYYSGLVYYSPPIVTYSHPDYGAKGVYTTVAQPVVAYASPVTDNPLTCTYTDEEGNAVHVIAPAADRAYTVAQPPAFVTYAPHSSGIVSASTSERPTRRKKRNPCVPADPCESGITFCERAERVRDKIYCTLLCAVLDLVDTVASCCQCCCADPTAED